MKGGKIKGCQKDKYRILKNKMLKHGSFLEPQARDPPFKRKKGVGFQTLFGDNELSRNVSPFSLTSVCRSMDTRLKYLVPFYCVV